MIIADQGLAKTFAAHIDYDYKSATPHQAAQGNAIAQAVAEANAKLALVTNALPPPAKQAKQGTTSKATGAVAAKTFSNVAVTITPLLTPDKLLATQQGQYLSNIMNLISGAQKTLYIQLQYIEASSGKDDNYDKLLGAIAERIKAGVDVKLIVSADYIEKYDELMKKQGVDPTANLYGQRTYTTKALSWIPRRSWSAARISRRRASRPTATPA